MSSEGLSTCNPYLTVLYNDESHTYESVSRIPPFPTFLMLLFISEYEMSRPIFHFHEFLFRWCESWSCACTAARTLQCWWPLWSTGRAGRLSKSAWNRTAQKSRGIYRYNTDFRSEWEILGEEVRKTTFFLIEKYLMRVSSKILAKYLGMRGDTHRDSGLSPA